MEDRDAEHKYVEYCLQLRGYGEEQLRARNADEEDCHIASSCYGIIIVNNNENLQVSKEQKSNIGHFAVKSIEKVTLVISL